ncbi:MAG: pancreas/duodenum homeobox protein 1 [Desulfobacteraceae bacterium]|jgi:hypothetical protein
MKMEQILTQDFLDTLIPPETGDRFFEALYGDASEGAYDIRLKFLNSDKKQIVLAFDLTERPGKCLMCSLTYGLPTVFSRHPLINIKKIVEKIEEKGISVKKWYLGETRELNSSNHAIPFYLDLA